ncbi:MAG: GTPase domain-containing protein [Pseudomonadota bacterium]
MGRLNRAADDPALSTNARLQARALATRLSGGVRIVLFGPGRVGTSGVCNALVGQIDPSTPSSVTRLFTLGSEGETATLLPETVAVRPLTAMSTVHAQLIDWFSSSRETDFAVQGERALQVADVVVWCTQDFGAEEMAVWSKAPDALKDHSMLVLTKADVLGAEGVLKARVERLQAIVQDEFHSLFPVAVSSLAPYLENSNIIPEEVFRASGVCALSEALQGIVSSGQRADLDSAILFLDRQGMMLDAPFSPGEQRPPQYHTPDTARSNLQHPVFVKARDAVLARALDLAEIGFDAAQGDLEEVFELCGAISEELIESLRDQAFGDSDAAHWCEAFEEAHDKIVLISVENDTRSAADAVTVLLQLRRDLECLAIG